MTHLADVASIQDHELPPRLTVEKAQDGCRVESLGFGHPRIRELERDVPLVDLQPWCRQSSGRLDLDSVVALLQGVDKRREDWRFERFPSGDHNSPAGERREFLEEATKGLLAAAGWIPRVLRVAPSAPHRAALETDEHGRYARRDAFPLD